MSTIDPDKQRENGPFNSMYLKKIDKTYASFYRFYDSAKLQEVELFYPFRHPQSLCSPMGEHKDWGVLGAGFWVKQLRNRLKFEMMFCNFERLQITFTMSSQPLKARLTK